MSKKGTIGLYLEKSDYTEYQDINEKLFLELEQVDDELRPEIQSKIILNNLKFVRYLMKKRFFNPVTTCQQLRVTWDDLFSVGYYGLIKAVHTFDVNKGYKFATYAARTIHNEYGMFIRAHQRSFSVGSIYQPQAMDADGKELTLIDLLEDGSDDIEEIILGEFGFIVMEELQRRLKPVEFNIIRAYVSGEDVTQQDIAKNLGLSQSYISRMLNKTLSRARKIYNELEVM